MQDFRNLKIWRKAHELALAVYKTTAAFPGEEKYGLVTQLRRAAVSLVSNIAEGSSRGTDGDFRRFLQIALGSLAEIECQLILSQDLAMILPKACSGLTERIFEVRRMIWPFVKRLELSLNRR